MHTITLNYSIFALLCVLLVVAVGIACTLFAIVKSTRRANAALSRAYSELVAGSQMREQELLNEVHSARVCLHEGAKALWKRIKSAESDADHLAPIVTQYLKDIDDTAALLKDDTPPAMTAARDALRLHAESLNLRSHATTPLRKEEPAQAEV